MISILFIGNLVAAGYVIYKTWLFEQVLNTQGQVIRLIVETPEINAVMLHELQRRQGGGEAPSVSE